MRRNCTQRTLGSPKLGVLRFAENCALGHTWPLPAFPPKHRLRCLRAPLCETLCQSLTMDSDQYHGTESITGYFTQKNMRPSPLERTHAFGPSSSNVQRVFYAEGQSALAVEPTSAPSPSCSILIMSRCTPECLEATKELTG